MNKEEIIEELKVLYKRHHEMSSEIIRKYASFDVSDIYRVGLHMKEVKTIVGYTDDVIKANKISAKKEEIKNSLLQEYYENGFIDIKAYRKKHSGLTVQIQKIYGRFWRALKDAGIRQKMPTHNMTKKECIEELKYIYQQYGKITKDIIDKYSITSSTTVIRLFGGIQKANELLKIKPKAGQRKNISKEELDKEIYRLINKNGYISKPMMERESYINPKVVNRIYGGFLKMYEVLNVPHSKNGRIPTDQDLIDDFLKIYNKYGYINKEMINQESEFSTTCYHDRFGSINELKEALGIKQSACGSTSSSKTADWCIARFENIIGQKAKKEKTFDWLINPKTNKKLRIDGYFSKIKTGIEYNGPQHYNVSDIYYESEDDLKHRKYLDKLKISLCKEHGIKIITVKYTDKINDDFIKEKLSD